MRAIFHFVERALVLAVHRPRVCHWGTLPPKCVHPWTLGALLRSSFIRIAVAMGLAISLLFGADSVQGDDTMQGTWKLIVWEVDGKALSEEHLQNGELVIKGDLYSVTLHGMGTQNGEQKLDPTSKIKTIDITGIKGPNKGETCLGIYELQGDDLHVTFAPPGKPRPTKMTTTPESGYWSHVWKRATE